MLCLLSFLLVMIPRPPISTLFPTRRSSDLDRARCEAWRCPEHLRRVRGRALRLLPRGRGDRRAVPGHGQHRAVLHPGPRSEEHTSELQSPYDLVCRLLLEKKKNKIYTTTTK